MITFRGQNDAGGKELGDDSSHISKHPSTLQPPHNVPVPEMNTGLKEHLVSTEMVKQPD